jgi:hypothetical protein
VDRVIATAQQRQRLIQSGICGEGGIGRRHRGAPRSGTAEHAERPTRLATAGRGRLAPSRFGRATVRAQAARRSPTAGKSTGTSKARLR